MRGSPFSFWLFPLVFGRLLTFRSIWVKAPQPWRFRRAAASRLKTLAVVLSLRSLPELRLSQWTMAKDCSLLAPMSIIGEVTISKVCKLKQHKLEDGRSEILPFRCTVSGSAKGKAKCYVHIYKRHATFDNEHWHLISLLRGPFDHTTGLRDLFAESCESIGDFTDIHVYQDGTYAIIAEMRNYQFFQRNMEGQWLAKVQPFDPEFFCVKVHANAVLLYAPFRSQLTLLQHLCLKMNLLPPSPRYWLMAEGSRWLRLEDGDPAKLLYGCVRTAPRLHGAVELLLTGDQHKPCASFNQHACKNTTSVAEGKRKTPQKIASKCANF